MFSTGVQVPIPNTTAADGHVTASAPRLDLSQLEANVSVYLEQALAPSTLRTYTSGQHRFLRFCQDADLSPLPLTEQTLSFFVAYLGREGLTHQTIKCYLSALHFMQIKAGQGDPFAAGAFPQVQYVLRGIKRSPRLRSPRPRLPITPAILRQLRVVWSPLASDPDYVMLWAACCLGFFGFMRAGEFTLCCSQVFDASLMLTVQDIAVDRHANPSMVRVHLKQSKTDPFRKGVDIFLGTTNCDLCPVAALLAYLAIRQARPGPLFVFKNNSPLTRDKLVAAIRSALSQAGVDTSRFTGHSFRIGAATSAAQAGLEDSLIKMLGRWESSAYQRYIRTPRDRLAAVSRSLAHIT